MKQFMLAAAVISALAMGSLAAEQACGVEKCKAKNAEMTPAQREEMLNKRLESIKAKDEALYKELVALKEKDPQAFKARMRELRKQGQAKGKGACPLAGACEKK